MKSLFASGAVLIFCASVFAQDTKSLESDVEKGRYLAVASDCAACHTAPGGKPFAGGLALASPIGEIYSTNITPSKTNGIGHYSLQEFSDAVRKGVRADGHYLYPAMPYASYAKLTDEDVRLLYSYFSRAVAAVDDPPAHITALPSPFNLRFSMLFWNQLFLDKKPFTPDLKKSAEWNRGKYLVEGPAHCGECHTPRGFFMQQQADKQLSGAIIGAWYAPNITPDLHNGIGGMSDDEIFHYLKFGKVDGKAQAGGEMGLAVQNSFSQMSDEDLKAIVAYIRTVPTIADDASLDKSKFDFGAPSNTVSEFRGINGAGFNQEIQEGNGVTKFPGGGAQLFAGNCASCHGVDAQGSRDGYFPSLFHNSALSSGNGRNLVATILFGINRETSEGLAFMPGFGGKPNDIANLSNNEVSDIANFLLRTYGNPAYLVTPDLVQEVRDGTGPVPLIVTIVNRSMWPAATLLLLLVGGLIFRFWYVRKR